MKKAFAVIIAAICLVSVCGCSLLDKDYTRAPKDFEIGGVVITLTEGFIETEKTETSAKYLSLNETMVTVGHTDQHTEDGEELRRLAEESKKGLASGFDSVSDVKEGKGYYYLECTRSENGKEMLFYVALFRNEDTATVVQFICSADKYSEYKEHFDAWAESVRSADET